MKLLYCDLGTVGDDISQVRAGISARPRAEDEDVHLHAR